jgi:hypothetical protein
VPFSIRPEFSPGAPGGVCFICRAAKRAGDVVVDCLVDPDELNWTVPTDIPGMAFELAAGSLEICSTCWTEASRELGMVSADQAAQLRDKVAKLENHLELANERARVYEEAVETLKRIEQVREVGNRVFGEDTE